MKEYKILVTGTVGAGKTTAIRAISDIEPVVTDVANHDSTVDKPNCSNPSRAEKPQATAAARPSPMVPRGAR